jgi:hypothetical protein
MGMWGAKSNQIKDEVLNHWIASADEKELEALKIPGLEISRPEHAEGGLLSAKRMYLRLMRERLAFDVCASPFGTRYFFSCRTVYSPATIKLWHVLVVCLFFALVYDGLERLLGINFAAIALAGLVLAIGAMFRSVLTKGLSDIDAALLKIPAVGPIYERMFRRETYYRYDTRLMYLDTVPAVIQSLADEVTAAKGVKLIREYQVAPILGELYKPLPPRTAKPEK